MQHRYSPDATNNPINTGSLLAAGAGAVGGLVGFLLGEVGNLFTKDGNSLGELILDSAIWAALLGTGIGMVVLCFDNWQSLRGRWNRDLWAALPLFAIFSFLGGAAGQVAYSFVQNSLTRGLGWALMGAGVGVGIGLLRRDNVQAQRGAMGGAIGGFIGGFLFDLLAVVFTGGDGDVSRAVGLIIMGAMIALLMRVVQDALKSAWLLGISTGPYEGKEYPLNTARVTVGQSELNDIALYREASAPPQLGAFVFRNDTWWWEGTPVAVNGLFQAQAALQPGDTIQLGATQFRYQSRSAKAPAMAPAPYAGAAEGYPGGYEMAAPPPAYLPPAATPPPTVLEPMPLPQQPMATVASMAWSLKNPATGSAHGLPAPPAQVRLGRASGNGIVLSDASVSSNHAQFEVGSNSLTITDLGSTNGTLVNGGRITPNQPVPLRDGDRLVFGTVEFRVWAT